MILEWLFRLWMGWGHRKQNCSKAVERHVIISKLLKDSMINPEILFKISSFQFTHNNVLSMTLQKLTHCSTINMYTVDRNIVHFRLVQ